MMKQSTVLKALKSFRSIRMFSLAVPQAGSRNAEYLTTAFMVLKPYDANFFSEWEDVNDYSTQFYGPAKNIYNQTKDAGGTTYIVLRKDFQNAVKGSPMEVCEIAGHTFMINILRKLFRIATRLELTFPDSKKYVPYYFKADYFDGVVLPCKAANIKQIVPVPATLKQEGIACEAAPALAALPASFSVPTPVVPGNVNARNNNKQDKAAKVKELTGSLEKGIRELLESDKYKEYLDVMSRFHKYSLNNCMLIRQQFPTATDVAGFQTWKTKFKRNVKRGAKGIKVLAPAPFKIRRTERVTDENGVERDEVVEVTVPNYKVVYVFDVSQTEGEPLPEIANILTRTVDGYRKLVMAIKRIVPVSIVFEEITNGAKGYYDAESQKIIVNKGMSEAQTLKTLIHEVAHCYLHSDAKGRKTERNIKELEAESTAYVVCKYLGVDSDDYSFGYIASWSNDKELTELKDSLGRIQSTATKIIERIENEMK